MTYQLLEVNVKYLILKSRHSASLIRDNETALEAVLNTDDEDDPSEIVKRFEAVCWCAASQVFAEHQGHEPYDMHFCKEDADNGDPKLCPHYSEQLAELEAR